MPADLRQLQRGTSTHADSCAGSFFSAAVGAISMYWSPVTHGGDHTHIAEAPGFCAASMSYPCRTVAPDYGDTRGGPSWMGS
jgi:hypothetical protein